VRRRRFRPTHEHRVLLLAALCGLPAVCLSLLLLTRGGFTPRAQWTLGLMLVLGWQPHAPHKDPATTTSPAAALGGAH